MTKKLTAKESKFIDEYLIDLNATQAAIRAGYSQKTAKEIGYENLTKPHIAEEIKKRQEKLQEKTQITQEWVINRLKLLSDYNAETIEVPFGSGDNAIIQKRMRDAAVATRNTELLGKHLGLFTEKVEHSGEIDINSNLTPIEVARELAFILSDPKLKK